MTDFEKNDINFKKVLVFFWIDVYNKSVINIHLNGNKNVKEWLYGTIYIKKTIRLEEFTISQTIDS